MSTSHRAHGLAGDHTAPDWPPLATAEVAALLAAFPEGGTLCEVRWHSPRPLSAAALVETDRGLRFIKRHHQRVRTVHALGEEHQFVAHLRARALPTPDLLRDRDGRTAIGRGDWTYEIQQPAQGIDLYRERMSWQPPFAPGHAHAAGRMLARLHAAADDYRAPQRSTHILVARSEVLAAADPVSALQAQLATRPGLAAYLAGRAWQRELGAALAPWHARVQPHLAAQPALWTHGDWHVSNLFWSGADATARVASVLDFGLAARNFALFDLATAIERNAIAWLDLDGEGARPDIALALIQGYREHAALPGEALAVLADLLPLVHIDFALSEVEYFHAITGSRVNADVAWETFLLGHAAWFRTHAGASFLSTIRDQP